MDIEYVKPKEIESRSFEILTKELLDMGISLKGDTAPVIKRCIHTSADFEYAKTLMFSPGAVEVLKKLIRSGADIVTDTNMALAGINKNELAKYDTDIMCFMADEKIIKAASENDSTRAGASMEYAIKRNRPTVFVVGNAPTALITLWEHYDNGDYKPDFVVGVPVGFVNVEAAKELIINSDMAYIVNKGRKGGSNIAAAIINAVLYEMRDEA